MPSRCNLQCLPLVRASALLPFLTFLNGIGAPVARLLHASKLPIDAVEDPEALLPLLNVCRFLDDAGRRERIANLGFQVGLQTPIESLGGFGQLVRQSVTLWDALSTAERLASTMSSGFGMGLERQGDWLWVHHRNLLRGASGSQQADGFGLMLIVNLIRLATVPTWLPGAVRLPMPPDADLADFELFSAASLQFRQASSAIAIPAALVSQPLAVLKARQELPRDLSAERLHSSAPALDLSGSIKQFLRARLPDGSSDIRRTAEAAGLSVRTLQRRLVDEGYAYSKLFDQARFDRAIELLQQSHLKIVDVAQELGYGDAANFTRAFRRWTGVSPLEFRRVG